MVFGVPDPSPKLRGEVPLCPWTALPGVGVTLPVFHHDHFQPINAIISQTNQADTARSAKI